MKTIKFKMKKIKSSKEIEALAVNLLAAERAIQKAWDESSRSLLCSDADKLIDLREGIKYTRLGLEDHLICAIRHEMQEKIGFKVNDEDLQLAGWELTEQVMKARGLTK